MDTTVRPQSDFGERMSVFCEAGLLPVLPNQWQLLQGTLEMTAFVLSPDVTSETSYRQSFWARPWVRQPFLLRHIGRDHFATGTGLGSRLSSVIRHLELTWHEGMPCFDLQLIQTHPGGLAALRRDMEALRRNDPKVAAISDTMRQLFPEPDAYLDHYLRPGGWIDRAAAFDYELPSEGPGQMPREFDSLISFVSYCCTLSSGPSDVGWSRLPVYMLRLSTRRFREQGATLWFGNNTNTQAA